VTSNCVESIFLSLQDALGFRRQILGRYERNSRVPVFVYEAKRKIGMFCMS